MPEEERSATFEARMVKRYAHPRERVYEAWTDARHVEKWLKPDEAVVMRAERFDFREGGQYLFHYENPDGSVFPVLGTFLTIVPEETLIFSWEPQEPDHDAGKETLVSVWFREEEGGTEVEVRHTLFPDRAMRERHCEGWTATLERLDPFLD